MSSFKWYSKAVKRYADPALIQRWADISGAFPTLILCWVYKIKMASENAG